MFLVASSVFGNLLPVAGARKRHFDFDHDFDFGNFWRRFFMRLVGYEASVLFFRRARGGNFFVFFVQHCCCCSFFVVAWLCRLIRFRRFEK